MTRLFKSSVITILFTLIILAIFPTTAFAKEYEPRLSEPQGEPYYTSELNAYAQTGYGMPNCVAYAYGRVYEMNGEAPKINRGSAGDWWFINQDNGYYEYGSEPKLGAVACWSRHVAVVENIADDGTVTISESHWGGTYFDTVEYQDVNDHFGQTFYGYIYTYAPVLTDDERVEIMNSELFTDILPLQNQDNIIEQNSTMLQLLNENKEEPLMLK